MNPDTGHLVDIEVFKESFPELLTNGYEPVPKELNGAAKKKLAGKHEAYVSLNSGGKLSKFASELRKGMRRVENDNVACPKRKFHLITLDTCSKCKKHGGIQARQTQIKCNFKEETK